MLQALFWPVLLTFMRTSRGPCQHADTDSADLGQGLRPCISNELQEKAEAAGSQTTP